MTPDNPWQQIALEEEMQVDRQIGLLYFRVEMENKELWIGYLYKERSSGDTADLSSEEPLDDDLEWTRWSFSEPPETLFLQPCLPDKTIVVHSEYPQHILPGDKARIFVGIPATVRFKLHRKEEQTLMELSSEPLPRTWFGDRLEGELCYGWSTRARRFIPEMSKDINRIGCPVNIRNSAEEELNFDKFSHRVTQLYVYKHNGGLWTDETQITYLGEEEMSEIVSQGKLPEELKGAEQVTLPREEVRRSFVSRTFLGLI